MSQDMDPTIAVRLCREAVSLFSQIVQSQRRDAATLSRHNSTMNIQKLAGRSSSDQAMDPLPGVYHTPAALDVQPTMSIECWTDFVSGVQQQYGAELRGPNGAQVEDVLSMLSRHAFDALHQGGGSPTQSAGLMTPGGDELGSSQSPLSARATRLTEMRGLPQRRLDANPTSQSPSGSVEQKPLSAARLSVREAGGNGTSENGSFDVAKTPDETKAPTNSWLDGGLEVDECTGFKLE